ncbi:MAG: non-ribosomal peptide synthetase [Leptolyngbya foveolarum]|uniref:Non-ribosomal peptide synthetase n=1 Tax=Leptolyngbya foveolarum TaxID=47253 RepID=A0A2W4VNZ1_9CYAN|nr:MAG: non-ribosomal peptide synthetase [Leptolyngbya foveolarum]
MSNTSTGNVEDFYPLSPIQQGMFFHSLENPSSDAYCGQMLCQLSGSLDLIAFEKSWQQAIDRHPILRTRFVWQGLKEPIQVVQRQVSLSIEVQDWQDLASEQQTRQLAQWRKRNRAQGFELSAAPLMRFTLIRITDQDYQFLWTYHHLLLDGWSMTMLFQDIIAAYQTYVEGKTASRPSLRPYRDYLVWLQKQDLSTAEQFWRKQLQGFTAPTAFCIDRSAGNLCPSASDRSKQQVMLTPDATRALQQFSQQHQLTLNTLIQGAWGLLLSRYSGETDLVFGATSSGRPANLAGVDAMLGVFINTLPLRLQVQPKANLLPWLHQIQVQQVEMRQYEYSPLAQVQRWSDISQGQPLFESLLLFQNYPVDQSLGSSLSTLTIQSVQTFEQTHYPLTILAGLSETLEIRILYDCQRFSDDTIARLLGHFKTVLASMVKTPQQTLAEIAWMTESEKQQILSWCHSQADVTADGLSTSVSNHRTLPQRFEAQVERTPDAIAVVFEEHALTYQALNRRANQLAHSLQQLGIEPEQLVGLCIERSLELVVGILGILKAGGAYVPIDPAAPPERLAFMVQDSQLKVLLTQAHLTELLTGMNHDDSHNKKVQKNQDNTDNPLRESVHTLCLDTGWASIAQCPTHNLESHITPDHLAYVIYTSGSTGKPKGVMVTHANVDRLFTATDQWFQFSDRDVWTLFHSFAFDFSVWEIWGALRHGGRLLIVPYGLSRASDDFYNWVCQAGVTVLNQTPSAFQQFMQAERESAQAHSLKLRYVIFGGEALDLASLKPWCDRHGDQQPQLINMYGITETTVHVTYRPITQTDIQAAAGSLIGRAIPDLQIHVLDAQQQIVPMGVPGELYVSGAGVARGYLNRPALTKERFITNTAHSTSPPQPVAVSRRYSRLYKTGDRVRYCPNGELEYLGRMDHQVKLRGFRIELGEIEAVLAQHPIFQSARVIVREDRPGDRRLVAYVVPNESCESLPEDLKNFLRRQLPDYMVPSSVVLLASLPLTLNGKLDRKALPAPQVHGLNGLSSTPLADGKPRSPLESSLQKIWSQVLDIESVGIYDNFFELGGHSLLAAQTVTRIRDTFAIELPIRALFETPTIATLAVVIEPRCQEKSVPTLPPIRPIPREGQLFPMSFSQRRLWVVDQLDPRSALYNIPAAVRLKGQLDLFALQQSFQSLVQRHEALRTTFDHIEGQPVQRIAPTAELPITVMDLSEFRDRETQTTTICLSEAQQPFDLKQDRLLRVVVLKLTEAEHVVLLTMHHIVFDGWSVGVLIQELAELYQTWRTSQTPTLPPLAIQYADFAAWQHQHVMDWLPVQRTYWTQQLKGAPSFLPLPTDHPRPKTQTLRGGQQSIQLTTDLSDVLTDLSRQESATLFMTLLAAFDVLLYYTTQTDDILVGSPIANRSQAELEPLLGFFVNTIVLRTRLSGALSFRDLLRQVRETTLGAYAHPDLPFEQLVDDLQVERNLSHNPLFQVWFVLQNTPTPPLELPELTISPVEIDQGTARYDLKLNLWESPEGIAGFWNYKADLFETTTIHRLSDTFTVLLTLLTQQPDIRLEDILTQLSERDRQQQQQSAQSLKSAGLKRLRQRQRKPLRG